MNIRRVSLLSRAPWTLVGQVNPDPCWKVTRHAHPYHQIIVILRGVLHVVIGGASIRATAGDVLLYPARTMHDEAADPSDPVATIFFSFRADGIPSGRLWTTRDTEGRIRQMALWMYELWQARDIACVKSELQFLTRAILAEFARTRDHGESPFVGRVKQFVREHLAERLTLDVLAHAMHISKYHFIRCYRAQAGQTPMAEVRAIRADQARTLILTTELPLKTIAARVGIDCEYTLARLFRRQFGMAPRQLHSHSHRHGSKSAL